MADYIQNLLQLHQLVGKMGELKNEIEKAAELLSECINSGGIIYVMGNGGSAADANHFSGEILGRFKRERRGLGCVSLSADNSSITAIANDYGYEFIFVRQLEGLFNPDKDIIFTMSTSGNSHNILLALHYVNKFGGKAINLLGKDGGEVLQGATSNEVNIIIPAQDTDRIQEMHKFILHYFAEVIEERYIESRIN